MGGWFKAKVRRIDAAQRRRRWLSFPYGVVKKFGEDEAGKLAALVAYYGFFSLFPLLLVMVTVLGYVLSGDPELQQKVLDSTLTQFPVIGDQIGENVESLDGNLLALTIGIVAALWAGLGALQAMESAMNEVWDVPVKERSNFIVKRLRALLMLGVFGVGIIGAVVLGAAGTFSASLGIASTVVGAVLAFALAIGVFLVAYRVLTNRDLAWSDLLPGAVIAGAGFLVLQLVGGYYVGRTVKGASQTYGVFAVVIGLLSWMYLLAQVALFAAEVNVVRAKRLWPRSLSGDDLTEADERALERHAKVEERRHDQHVDSELRPPADERPGDEVPTRK